MSSLGAHMRRTGSHGDRRFHPDCPLGQADRVSGKLTFDERLTGRVRAGLVAALLAVSGVPAFPAAAGEPDVEHEGAGQQAPNDADPSFDEGSQDVELPVEDGSAIPLAEDEGDVERAPEGEEDFAQEEPESSGPAPEAPAQNPIGAPPPASQQPETAPPESDEPEDETKPRLGRRPEAPSPKTLRLRAPGPPPSERRMKSRGGSPAPNKPADPTAGQRHGRASAAPSADREASFAAKAARTQQVRKSEATGRRGHRTHVVRHGECLWSIAEGHIGSDATPAQIARLVKRLWELNARRIGTGDPDMLMVGTKLRLP